VWIRFKKWALLSNRYSVWKQIKPWGENWKHGLLFWITLAVLLVLSDRLAHLWAFEYAGLVTSDAVAQLRSRLHPPEHAKHAAVIAITSYDRKELLGGTSPIRGDRLLHAVCAILRQQPRVLGVDIDTSQVSLPNLPKTRTKIIWSQGVKFMREEPPNQDKLQVKLDYVLGNEHLDLDTGLAVASASRDWSIRQIDRCYAYNKEQAGLTFVAALTAAYAKGTSLGDRMASECREGESDQVGSYVVNYSFDRFTLSNFEQNALKEDLSSCLNGHGEFSLNAQADYPLKDKVVLLGGEYDPQDWHPTPFGLKPGAEVEAALVEHLLQASQGRDIDAYLKWGIKVILAFLIVVIHSRLRPVAALLVSVFFLGSLVILGNVIAALITAYRATTVPFLTGIMIEQLATSAERAQEKIQTNSVQQERQAAIPRT
jgi:CHASE2 domain-containing sensor protein